MLAQFLIRNIVFRFRRSICNAPNIVASVTKEPVSSLKASSPKDSRTGKSVKPPEANNTVPPSPVNPQTPRSSEWIIAAKVLAYFAGSGGGATLLAMAYSYSQEKQRIPRILHRYEQSPLSEEEHNDLVDYFRRPQLESELTEVIAPSMKTSTFRLITGPHGTGKTTSVKYCCNEKKSGVVYAFIEEAMVNNQRVPTVLAQKLAIETDRRPWYNLLKVWQFGYSEPVRPFQLTDLLSDLRAAASEYRKANDRPLALVIDNFTTIAKHDPVLFSELMSAAKTGADNGDLIITFVSSDGYTPHWIQGLGIDERLGPFEVGDLSPDEAYRFATDFASKQRLHNSHQVGEQELVKLVELTGGRIQRLRSCISDLLVGKSLSQVQSSIESSVFGSLKEANLQGDPIKAANLELKAFEAARAILASDTGTISRERFYAIIDDASQADSLLVQNIFCYHPSLASVGFQTAAHARYFRHVFQPYPSFPVSRTTFRVRRMILDYPYISTIVITILGVFVAIAVGRQRAST